jgi:hypothetical protein
MYWVFLHDLGFNWREWQFTAHAGKNDFHTTHTLVYIRRAHPSSWNFELRSPTSWISFSGYQATHDSDWLLKKGKQLVPPHIFG